jgi:hypothetical protein
LEATAADDVLDLLDILITEIFSDATKAGEKARLRSIKDLDLAASQLGVVCHLVLDPDVPDAELRAAIFKALQREKLESALNQVDTLVRPPDDMYLSRAAEKLGKNTAHSPAFSEGRAFWIHTGRTSDCRRAGTSRQPRQAFEIGGSSSGDRHPKMARVCIR